MIPAHLLNQEELASALVYLTGAIPCKTTGVRLITREGELVGEFPAREDGRQVGARVSAALAAQRLARQMGHGDSRYSVFINTHGTTLVFMLDDAYLVSVTMGHVKSLDALMKSVDEGLQPLLDVLGLR